MRWIPGCQEGPTRVSVATCVTCRISVDIDDKWVAVSLDPVALNTGILASNVSPDSTSPWIAP